MKSVDISRKKLTDELTALRRQVSQLEELAGERKQEKDRIKQTAEEWETTFDSITDMVSIHDADFRLKRVNRRFAEVFGMKAEEFIGRHCYEVFHKIDGAMPDCPYKKIMATGKPAKWEYFEPSLGINLEVSASPLFNKKGEMVACVHVARDISEWKQMEESMVITDRLASIGELVSGVAHELNNPLTSVIGYLELLLGEDVPDKIREDIAIAHHEALRAAEVVSNLLTFARKHAPSKKLVNINGIIATVLRLRAYEQKVRNIKVNTGFANNLPLIMADNFQLQQVFLNIVINAEYFMIEAHNRGALTITTEKAGDIVRVSFADDGPGIPEENLKRIFTPFFTTKEEGKGTGLGLSICLGIVAGHSGRIYATNQPGGGANFIVELPIVTSDKGDS
jgi:PAS domain S-box-containing protein